MSIKTAASSELSIIVHLERGLILRFVRKVLRSPADSAPFLNPRAEWMTDRSYLTKFHSFCQSQTFANFSCIGHTTQELLALPVPQSDLY